MFAVKLGVLTKALNCEICGIEGKMEGHHEDYSKPLDVKWVCKTCHKHIHKKIKG
jgi:transposase-like protein